MGVFNWLERKVFLGDVIKDYGVLDDKCFGTARWKTSVLLCRRKGQLKLVFRNAGAAPFGASVQYTMVDATTAALARLAAVVNDAHAAVSAEERQA